jgi:hypothetical protein
MKLNQLPNFRVEDFQSEQSWIGRLFTQLNPFIQAVNQTFDNNLDFSTNIKSVTTLYNISSFQSFSLQWPYPNNPPADLRVIQAAKGSAMTPTILMASWSYDSTKSVVTVHTMIEVSGSGTTALSGTYRFTIRVNI